MRQFTLPEEQIKRMIPGFLDALRSHLSLLKEALESGDKQDMGKKAHTIKGAFLNLGLENCAEIALAIEINSKAGKDFEYSRLVDDLQVQLAPLLKK